MCLLQNGLIKLRVMNYELRIKNGKKLKSSNLSIFQFYNFPIFQSFNLSILKFLIFNFLILNSSYAQFTSDLKSNLKQHISILASDEYEGRGAGTKGEKLAADYIAKQFSALQVLPAGDSGTYFQKFKFTGESHLGSKNGLTIDGKPYAVNTDFYPLSYSSNDKIKAEGCFVGFGISAPDLHYDDYLAMNNLKGKIFIIDISSPDGTDPHTTKYHEHIDMRKKIELAIQKGASAVVFINRDHKTDNPGSKLNTKIFPTSVPVIFAEKSISKKLAKCKNCEIEIETEIVKIEKEAQNVMGYIDNKASQTVIIGAHYDHLGWHHSGSLYGGKDSLIHNGADDNASGVAGLIELARMFQNSNNKNNNYLFIAFSGEESGLLGSAHYVGSSLFDKEHINYMLNMDMIGRLDSVEKKLIINGNGTSPVWTPLINNSKPVYLSVTTSESGVGPSDHTSFYLKDIPVLHFFSGLHMDYHKPADDEYKINYTGMEFILKYMVVIVDSLDKKGKITFTKTQDKEAKATPKFSVTLGVMPDYSYSEKGLKITGVTEGKPAQIAGLQANDVIIKLGNYEIVDIYSYMNALSKFKKGEKTTALVSRNNQELSFVLVW